jgi:two-component system chemotaxis response regulator CheB
VFDRDPGIEVVAVAQNGIEAVQQAELTRPDVVLMDVHMPRMDGYEATRHIMERSPRPVVLISSSFDADEVEMSFEAMQAGALTVVSKPTGLLSPDGETSARRLIETLRLMSEVKVVRRRGPRTVQGGQLGHGIDGLGALSPFARSGVPPAVVAIGASTGGPAAIAQLLGELSGRLTVPVLIVQHIAPGFAEGLGRWLQHTTHVPVRVASEAETLQGGTAYLATESAQLGVTGRGSIALTRNCGLYDFCPSATHLFRSVAAAYGARGMGILLTGMGKDGADGLFEMRRTGAITIAQDPESCVVNGMPEAAVQLGAATHVLSPQQIGRFIGTLLQPTGTSSREANASNRGERRS